MAERLKQFRDREMFRIDLRHITRRIDFQQFSSELSDLAEVVIQEAARLCWQSLLPRYGIPTLSGGAPLRQAQGRLCPWSICALGKFGGRELGFGSDVELLIVYGDEGETAGPEVVPNSQFFEELVRSLLAAVTSRREGVFEVDLRLRPYGSAGPLASTLGAFARYYSETGDAKQFERLALVKLRPIAGDGGLAGQVVTQRDAFVYSGKPVDIENVLHLRRRQASELVPRGAVSAKYSPGGLVDVEYYVQARQIKAGFADSAVRVSNTLEAVRHLAAGGHLDGGRAERLTRAYGFLRRLIDALRVVRGNARDLTIPAADSREFSYLARRLQYESAVQLQSNILEHMQFAQHLWEDNRYLRQQQ